MRCIALALATLLIAAAALAANYPSPVEHDFVVSDFHFENGETMAEVRIHYATIGTARRDAQGVVRNAVLVLHGTGGSLHQFLSDRYAGVLFVAGVVLV